VAWLTKLGLGRLPGDIVIERDGFRLYFPLDDLDPDQPRPFADPVAARSLAQRSS
jgi:hypothetical protein